VCWEQTRDAREVRGGFFSDDCDYGWRPGVSRMALPAHGRRVCGPLRFGQCPVIDIDELIVS
jgi:hypothetical protein